jgi:SNF2 family DNA or RNA helicase
VTGPPLWAHQAKEAEEHAWDPRRALFWDKRCGKSRGAAASLARVPIRRVICVAPLSVCPSWEREFAAWNMDVVPVYRQEREEAITAMKAAYKDAGGVVIVPWRRLAAKTAAERTEKKESRMTRALMAYGAHGLIVDESHNAMSPSAQQARVVRRLAKQAEWVRLLTGTPAPNHYGDLWGQLVMLDTQAFGSSFRAFAERYLVRDEMFPSRILAHKNVSELQALMAPLASHQRREDIFGPDQWIEETRGIVLPVRARDMYDKLAREWVVEDPELGTIDASAVLARLTRLQQLASGFLPQETGGLGWVHREKVAAIVEDLDDIVAQGDKAVVFHKFTAEGDAIAEELRGKCEVLRIRGDVPVMERQRIMDRMAEPGARVAIVQTRSGGVGVSFAEVPYQLVASQSFSFVDEDQAHDRTYKPKTARFVTHYRAAGTIDDFIAETLASKQDIHQAVRNADRRDMAFGKLYRPKLRSM